MRVALAILIAAIATIPASTQTRPRGRDLGIPFPGQTGANNAITDVAGVAVGHVTLIEGEGKLVPGQGPDAHGRHRYPSSTARQLGSGVCRDVQSERQR